MPHLWLASRGAKLSRCEKRWKRRVVEHSVLASTIVSLEFLDLSTTSIKGWEDSLYVDLELPFFRSLFGQTSRVSVRKASRVPECLAGTRGSLGC